jgi:hypothetical protein
MSDFCCYLAVATEPLIASSAYSPNHLERLYEKPSQADQPPHHQATHGTIYQRFAARTQPLVSFAHPSVLVDPRKRPLHHPPPRQHLETWRSHELLSIYRATPSLAHSLAHDFRTSSGAALRARSRRSTLLPRAFSTQFFALVLPAVATIHPQMTEAGKLRICLPQ